MVEPHGGRLVYNVVEPERGAGLPGLEIKPTLGPDGAPIRNPYREVVSIAMGFFSPVEGFMTRNEVDSVLRERRLLSGWLFPFPLIFDVDEEDLKKAGIKEGDAVALTLKGRPFAILQVEEVYKLGDRKELADAVFGTPEKNGEVVKRRFDEKHPGWLIYRSLRQVALAGKVWLLGQPKFREPYSRFWMPPAASRKYIEERGWKIVVAHQTRNVPHVGHEMLMKAALFSAGCGRPGDAVLVNAIIGAKRPGDYVDEAILEGHEALNKAGYFHPSRHVVTMTLWDMRYGGPLESILHGIIRQNMGATHHMFGRDHASVGDYYDPYATQYLWTHGLPSYGLNEPPHLTDKGLRIRPVVLGEFAYCPTCGGYTYLGGPGELPLCGHEVERLSGSLLRGVVLEGLRPPRVVMRLEVYDVIVKWWRVYGYPFVNERYLRLKEEQLEVV
ncbi:sulfate adenylyltransferase [Pyrobaculum islandicum DSM 4184]|uniref:sulfate adenylyltransferase n=1 Tax=Pyrobaculum islandicum (strain DSM 4184 / JCM 9189 / GEO3) TaxID=384616 RepID=A1RUN5_PYRIL|nr:sulfate adenylyltransferase [Pyrobaculum islandicum]ABL88667.1 sulfate adenylyltransferase [Pyrobaculum islandicum DSM 4184]